MTPYTDNEVYPPSDKYGARQIVLQSHIGTLYDKQRDLLKVIEAQQADIAELRESMLELVELCSQHGLLTNK